MEAEGDYGLPEVLQQFHSLYPLEDLAAAEAPSPVFGVATQAIKGVASLDGQAAALRRIDGRQARAIKDRARMPYWLPFTVCFLFSHA